MFFSNLSSSSFLLMLISLFSFLVVILPLKSFIISLFNVCLLSLILFHLCPAYFAYLSIFCLPFFSLVYLPSLLLTFPSSVSSDFSLLLFPTFYLFFFLLSSMFLTFLVLRSKSMKKKKINKSNIYIFIHSNSRFQYLFFHIQIH